MTNHSPAKKRKSFWKVIIIGVSVAALLWIVAFVVIFFVLNAKYQRDRKQIISESGPEARAVESAQRSEKTAATGDAQTGPVEQALFMPEMELEVETSDFDTIPNDVNKPVEQELRPLGEKPTESGKR